MNKGLLMKKDAKYLDLFNREQNERAARNQLYYAMTFQEHLGSRIAENIKNVLANMPAAECHALFGGDRIKANILSKKVKEIVNAQRRAYRRTRGHAANTIDAVAKAANISALRIIAPNIKDAFDFIDGRLQGVLISPDTISEMEKTVLRSRLFNIQDIGVQFTATSLEKMTIDISLPPWFFWLNEPELRAYMVFRKDMIILLEQVYSFYLNKKLRSKLCVLVCQNYRELTKYESNDLNSFIDEFYVYLRRRLLDGNTLFSVYSKPFSSWLEGIFKYFLIDKCRILRSHQARRAILESELFDDDSTGKLEDVVTVTNPKADLGEEYLRRAVQRIPVKTDREALNTAINCVNINGKPIRSAAVKRAMNRWSPSIHAWLANDRKRLPKQFWNELVLMIDDPISKTLRRLMILVENARDQGHKLTWVSEKGDIPYYKLRRWFKCEQDPTPTELLKLNEAIDYMEALLEKAHE